MSSKTTSSLHIGRTSADGRPLSEIDSLYFKHGLSHIAALLVFRSAVFFRSDKKIKAAFLRAIETTPLLQTEIVDKVRKDGDDDSETTQYYFRQMHSKARWRAIEIENCENQKQALKKARSIMIQHVAELNQSIDSRRVAPRVTAVRGGKSKLVFSIVIPHTFTDAVGGFGFMKKFLLYAVLPRALWSRVDRLSGKNDSKTLWVPTVEEMALKNRFDLYRQDVSVEDCVRYDPRNFHFDFNIRSPDAASQVNGIDFESVGNINSKQLKKIRGDLRTSGTSFTYALAAVALKTLAAILVDCCGENENMGPLVFIVPVDSRKMGEWGDHRDKKGPQFPVLANLTFLTFAQVTIEDLMTESLEQVAGKIKKYVTRLHSDLDYLLQQIKASGIPDSLGYVCGCSSVNTPNTALARGLGLAPTHCESGIKFGLRARCWLTAISFGAKTEVVADIMLPIPGLSGDKVRQILSRVVAGTAMESLFNKL